MRTSKLGTIVRLPDGRVGTTVYNGLDGVGIKWGVHYLPKDFVGTSGGLAHNVPPADWPWFPDAMLREPYPSASLPCVGENFEIVGEGDEQEARGFRKFAEIVATYKNTYLDPNWPPECDGTLVANERRLVGLILEHSQELVEAILNLDEPLGNSDLRLWCAEVVNKAIEISVLIEGRTSKVEHGETYWGDPTGNIRRMSGEQEVVATVTPTYGLEEWNALCSIKTTR